MNILVIGNGHYTSGMTSLEGQTSTDKDWGVVLPSLFELRNRGLINGIKVAARNGKKLKLLKQKLIKMESKMGWDTTVEVYPKGDLIDEKAYLHALKDLEKKDAVIICTPDETHKSIVSDVIKAGKHYMVVKPAVTKKKDLEKIISLQKENNVFGMVDYHKVFDEANLYLKDAIENNIYGDIHHIYSKQTQRRDMLNIFCNWLQSSKTNVNHYLGSHYIHMTSFLTKATPLNVRATGQYGIAKNEYGINTPDYIETQVQWKALNGKIFSSYHISGWADPSETAGMTYQELRIIAEKGIINSDQRNRGCEEVLVHQGHHISNPYFFSLHKGIQNRIYFDSKYGFISIKTFVETVKEINKGQRDIESIGDGLPTIEESYNVTRILEAADISLSSNSSIIEIANI